MSLIRRAVERRGADPRAPWGDSIPLPNSLVGYNAGGVQVTEDSAKAVAAVYGCVSLLADSVSSLPTGLRNGVEIRASKTLPASPLLEQPYVEISRRDWWVQFIWGLALRGNFFGHIIERDQFDRAIQIKPIHNDHAEVRRLQDGTLQYRFYGKVVPVDDVLHVRYQSSPGNVMGMSPIQVCAIAFGLPMAQDRYAEAFYLNRADPRGVVQIPGNVPQQEIKKMARGWVAAFQGSNNAHLPAFLTEGAEFKPITISPGDAQLLEVMQFSEERICGRIFRVPPHMVGIVEKETSFGRGLEQQTRNFYLNTLTGYLTIGQETMSTLHGRCRFMHFDTTDRERGTTLERAQAAGLLLNAGAAQVDDVRPWFDWPDLQAGDGKNSFLPINTQLLDAALLALEQAKNPPAPLPAASPGGGTPSLPAGPPAVPAKNGNGNGKPALSREQAEAIVRQAITELEQRQGQHDLLLRAIGDREGMSVNVYPPAVTVERTEVNVGIPEVRVEAPNVSVQPADVTVHPATINLPEMRVEPAVVNVAAPEVHVEPTPVHVDAPSVTVQQPEIRVDAPEVHFEPRVESPSVMVNPQIHVPEPPAKHTVRQVERNEKGQIARVVETDAQERRTVKRVERDEHGQIVRVVEEDA